MKATVRSKTMQPLGDLVQGAGLGRVAHQVHVVQQALPVPGHMRVQVAHAHAPAAQRHRPVQALGEFVLAADAARLDGQHLGRARLGRLVHRGPDPGQSVEHPDRHALGARVGVAAEGRVPLEGGHRRAHARLRRDDVLVHLPQQPCHDLLRRGRHQPAHVVGVGMQQRQLDQAGHGPGVLAGHPAASYRPGVHPVPRLAQAVSTVRMRFLPVPGHLLNPRFKPLPERNYARLHPPPQHGFDAPAPPIDTVNTAFIPTPAWLVATS